MKKNIILVMALLFTTVLPAKEYNDFSKREVGVIQGCGIGIGLRFGTASKQKILDLCTGCLNNVLHDKNFTKKAANNCASVASDLKKQS